MKHLQPNKMSIRPHRLLEKYRIHGIFETYLFFFRKLGLRFKSSSADVAQLDRVSGYEPEGRGFESCHPHHPIQKPSRSKVSAVLLFIESEVRNGAQEKSFCFFPATVLSFVSLMPIGLDELDPKSQTV